MHVQQQLAHRERASVAEQISVTAWPALCAYCCLLCPPGFVQCQWFRQHQQSTVEQVKGQLWSHWLPKCIDVYRRLPPVAINNDVKAYFR